MRIIAKRILRNFWSIYPDCEQQLKAWHKEVSLHKWKSPGQIKKNYPTVSFLENNRVIFNIKGNNYRLIVRISYDHSMVWIRFIGTHAAYDKIDATKI